jgi:hypothetical protein
MERRATRPANHGKRRQGEFSGVQSFPFGKFRSFTLIIAGNSAALLHQWLLVPVVSQQIIKNQKE